MPALGTSHFADVDPSRRIHYCAAGSGPVTVLFESGMGRSRNAWSAVAPAVAEFATVITYDRAGTGRSDAQPGPRAIEDMITDHLAVRAASVDGPCVLVGHSYGGPVARGAAVRHPENVVGVVLVDEVSELCDRVVYGTGMLGAGLVYRGRLALARLGLLRRLVIRPQARALHTDTGTGRSTPEAVEQIIDEVATEDGSVGSAQAALREWLGFTRSIRRFRATGPWVPDAPMTTISANRLPPDKRAADYLAQAHRDLAELSDTGRHVYSRTNSHNIHLVEPAAVIDEIRRHVDAVAGVPTERLTPR